MPEIYIQIFIDIVVYIIIMRLVSGGQAFSSWQGFFNWNILLLLVLAFLDFVSGGAFLGIITICSP